MSGDGGPETTRLEEMSQSDLAVNSLTVFLIAVV